MVRSRRLELPRVAPLPPEASALSGLKSLAAGNLGVEPFECLLDRSDLSEVATGVGVARPERAIRVQARTIGRMRTNAPDIDQSKLVLQPVAVAERFAEKLSRIQKKNRCGGIDLCHEVKKH